MTTAPTPAAEVDIDGALVRALLAEQHPDLAGLALVEVASGWDNVMFRLGDELAVRLPRRALAAPLVEDEQRWLPVLAPRLPLPTPVPVRIGRPGYGYPWSWSICPWLPGSPAALTPPNDPVAAALALGGFLSAMHQPAPADAPTNPYRGVPLTERAAAARQRIEQLGDLVDGPAVLAAWDELVGVAPWSGPAVWLHGDMHPMNILVDEGRVSGVIDFGDVCAGDPASDLSVAWMMLPPEARPSFRRAAANASDPIDDDTWARSRASALAIALAILASSADNPAMHAIGARTLAAVLDDR